jgi:hypothetical protein
MKPKDSRSDADCPFEQTRKTFNAEPAKPAAAALRHDDVAVLMNALQQEGRLIVGYVGPPRETAPPAGDRAVAEDESEGGCGHLARVEDVTDRGARD